MNSPNPIQAPTPQAFGSASELAAAYDKARNLLENYEQKYGEGNFHVVLGDGNIDRGFVIGDYNWLANADHTSARVFYPDPDGLAWMEAALILPEITFMGVMCGTETLFAVESTWDHVDETEYAFDVVCPRCATYRTLDEMIDIYKTKITCESDICTGRGELSVTPLRYNDLDEEDVKMMLAKPTE